MHVVFVYADSPQEWNCSQWRSLSPADVINRSGKHSAKLVFLDSFADYQSHASQDLVGAGQVIVVQRNLIIPAVWEAIEYWRGLGRTVIADLDDDYPHLPWSNPAHEFWIKNTAELPESPIALLTQGLRRCDALASPSRVILDDWKDIVPGVWIPNYAQGNWYLNLPKREVHKDKIIIGWGGSVSHLDSWLFSGAKDAIEELVVERDNVYVMLCGNDERLVSMLKLPPEKLIRQPGVQPQDWPKVVSTFDIGVAPLDLKDGDKSYDHRRSWIKALEFLLCGVPWVASKSRPYEDFEQYGQCVDNTKDAWKDALAKMIDNLPAYKREARRNRRIGWANTLEQNVDNLVESYERVELQSKPQLPQAFYVNWSGDGKGLPERRAAAREAVLQAQHTKGARKVDPGLQVRTWGFVERLLPRVPWYGIDLTQNMKYDLLQRVNRFWLEDRNEQDKAQAAD